MLLGQQGSDAGFDEFGVNYTEDFFSAPTPPVPPVNQPMQSEQPIAPVQSDVDTQLGDWPDGHPMQASQEEKRYQYWQSQHDRLKNEYETLRQSTQEVQAFVPVARYLQENPHIIQALESHLAGTTATPAQAQQVSQPQAMQPQVPAEPTKPADYNLMDMHDPSTDSGKYEIARRQYELDLLKYERESFQRDRKEFESYMNEQKMAQQKQQQTEGLFKTLESDYQLDRDSAQKFVQEMSDPSTLELKSLIEFWKFKNGKVAPQAGQQVQQRMQQIQKTMTRTPSLASVPGQGGDPMDADDMFNLSLKQWGSRGRSF